MRNEEGWKKIADSGLFSKFRAKFEQLSDGNGYYIFENNTGRNIITTLSMQGTAIRYGNIFLLIFSLS